MTKITFINGESKCGCTMEFSDGHGEYSDVHEITLCAEHDRNRRPKRQVISSDEAIRRMQYRIDNPDTFGEPFN